MSLMLLILKGLQSLLYILCKIINVHVVSCEYLVVHVQYITGVW